MLGWRPIRRTLSDSHFNPVRPDLEKTRVFRGSSFRDHSDDCTVSGSNTLNADGPSTKSELRGFRLVRVRVR